MISLKANKQIVEWGALTDEQRKDLLEAYALNFDGQDQAAARAVSAMIGFSQRHDIAITLSLVAQAEKELLG